MTSSLLEGVGSRAGTYILFTVPSGEFCIGSTTDFETRFGHPYLDSTKPHLRNRPLYVEASGVGGFSLFLWEPTVFFDSYYFDFIRDNTEHVGN
jgi:hypothetical protein